MKSINQIDFSEKKAFQIQFSFKDPIQTSSLPSSVLHIGKTELLPQDS